jgi:hypothetical protein
MPIHETLAEAVRSVSEARSAIRMFSARFVIEIKSLGRIYRSFLPCSIWQFAKAKATQFSTVET